MSRPSSSFWARIAGHALPIIGVACLAFASPADARIGNPLKKVKEKITKPVEEKAAPQASAADEPVVFDHLTVELTEARVQSILRAFAKAHEAAAPRPALVEKLNKAADDRNKLLDKNEAAISALRNKRDEIKRCYADGYNQARNKKMQEYQENALTDPALRERFTKIAMENNAAIAKGDTAAVTRANTAILAEMLPSHQDSVKVREACGALPPPSAAETALEGIDKQTASLNDEIRNVDNAVAEAQANQGGLDREQWATALERIQGFLGQSNSGKSKSDGGKSKRIGKSDNSSSGSGNSGGSSAKSSGSSGASIRGYSQEEIDALEKHLEELRAALG